LKKRINLGSGTDYKKDWINVDLEGKRDLTHDLNEIPYPIDPDSVDYIKIHHVLEYLDSPVRVLEELHRICKKGAIVDVEVPYGVTTTYNPWHKHDFIPKWFETLIEGTSESMKDWRERVKFRIKSMKVKRGDHAFWRKYEIRVLLEVVK